MFKRHENVSSQGLLARVTLSVGAGLVALGVGGLLLAHCGVAIPGLLTGGAPVRVLDYCSGQYPSDFAFRLVHQLEGEHQALLGQCGSEPDEATDGGDIERTDLDNRLERERAGRGTMDISLAWNTVDDLDLFVACPDGAIIYFRKRTGCGGELDVDMNVHDRDASSEPIEHVVWTSPPPAGHYRVYVSLFARRKTDAGEFVPFTLQIERPGTEVERIRGEAKTKVSNGDSSPPRTALVTEFAVE